MDRQLKADNPGWRLKTLMLLSVAKAPLRVSQLLVITAPDLKHAMKELERNPSFQDIRDAFHRHMVEGLVGDHVEVRQDGTLALKAAGDGLGFDQGDAEWQTCKTCMRLMTQSSPWLRYHGSEVAWAGGVDYAWQWTFSHLERSGRNMDDIEARTEVGNMVHAVTRALRVSLAPLEDALMGPIRLPPKPGRIRSEVAVKTAQQIVQKVLWDLVALGNVHDAKQFDDMVTGRTKAFEPDKPLLDDAFVSLPFVLVTANATALLRRLARRLCQLGVLTRQPLADLAQALPEASLDVLPRCFNFTRDLFAVVKCEDAAAKALYKKNMPSLSKLRKELQTSSSWERALEHSIAEVPRPEGISASRLNVVLAMGWVSALFTKCTPQYVVVNVPKHGAEHALSRFSCAHMLEPLHDSLSKLLFGHSSIDSTHAALCRNGYRRCAAHILLAVSINQIRRVLAPWLLQFIFHPAFDQVKLAHSLPYHYLEQGLSFSWLWVPVWAVQLFCLSLVHKVVGLLFLNGDDSDLTGRNRCGPLEQPTTGRLTVEDAMIVWYLVMSLARVEYAFTKTAWAFAQVFAYSRLLIFGESGELRLLGLNIWAHKTSFVFHAVLLGYLFRRSIVPFTDTAVQETLRGQPSLLAFYGIVWGLTTYVIRYSNKYFMAIEMSGSLMTYALMAAWLGYLAVRLTNDPLDMDDERRRLGLMIKEARGMLNAHDGAGGTAVAVGLRQDAAERLHFALLKQASERRRADVRQHDIERREAYERQVATQDVSG